MRFLVHGSGYTLGLTDHGALLALSRTSPPSRKARGATAAVLRGRPTPARSSARTLSVGFLGASAGVRLVAGHQLPGRVNYLIGNDRRRWQTNIATFSGAAYRGVWPGIDASFSGSQRQLEYVFTVAPGADPGRIRLGYGGQSGLRLDRSGNLIVAAGTQGTMRQLAPHAYQVANGRRLTVASRYVLSGGRVTITLGAYDHRQALVIDPTVTLAYSTYIGGMGVDFGTGIAVDSAGSAYVTGATGSTDFPVTPGAFQTTYPGQLQAAFVSKLNPAGTALLYSTYLGGTRARLGLGDAGNGIAVDSAGSAYVTGRTSSFDFPTTPGAFQSTSPGLNNDSNAFVSKLKPDGTGLLYSTYLGPIAPAGGSAGSAEAKGIVVDSAGSAYVTGRVAGQSQTNSSIFPTTPGAFQSGAFVGGEAGFVTKFNASGSGLVYSTLLHSSDNSGNSRGNAIALDAAGSAYVTGSTDSPAFPTMNPVQAASGGGVDAFVTELNPAGTRLVYSTYLGGNGTDRGFGIAVNSGSAYVTGITSSANLRTTTGAYQPNYGGGGSSGNGGDAFVVRFSADGSALVYSTYLGGTGDDSGSGIAVDSAGSAFVTGRTLSANFPHSADAYQPAYAGAQDAFVTKLKADGTGLLYSTFLGGTGADGGNGIALDSAANPYITGITDSTNFPTANPEQAASAGSSDAFVAKFGPAPASMFSLSAHTAGAGSDAASATGTIVSDSGAISCARSGGSNDQGTCSHSFTSGTVVRLTATPDAQSTASLSGDCTVSAGAVGAPVSCSVTVDQARSVTATFTRQPAGGGGSGFSAAPTVAQSCQASAITQTRAALSASVNPNGTSTTYHFDYGTSVAYGSRTPEQPVGSDAQQHMVSASVSALQPGTAYHCRAVAMSSSGTTYGADQRFTTVATQPGGVALAPTVQGSCQASSVSRSGVKVSGSVVPNGQATSAFFQFGASTSYGRRSAAQPVGSGSQASRFSVMLGGLRPNTTYHCRVVAANQTGTTHGSDATFTTHPQPGGGGHGSRGASRLRLDSISARPARRGCMVEYSGFARDLQLSDRDCTAALLTLTGKIDPRADAERIMTTLHANIDGQARTIVAHARVTHGRFSFTVKLPGRQHERGDHWTFTISYPGDPHLRSTGLTGGFLLETETMNHSRI